MKNKDFKLLLESFNKYLLNEHVGHTPQCSKLFDSIPDEFKDYINDSMNWHNGDAWMSETDHGGDQDGEQDEKLLFEEVAKACGCKVEDLLVNFDDSYRDDISDSQTSQQISAEDFLNSYQASGSLCGSFEMNGVSLKGFYFSLGTDSSQFGLQFRSMMSDRSLKGLIFVAPDCSNSISSIEDSRSESKPKFKTRLGGAWG